jgi:hypothetical protein
MKMKTEEFNTRLKELSIMVGNSQSTELFNQEYESLLNEVKAQPGPRYEMLARMRRLLDHQAQYLMNAWLRYNKAVTPPHMIRMQ